MNRLHATTARVDSWRASVDRWSAAFAKTRLVDVLGIDLRSLALFRILIGLVALFDLLSRWPYLVAHYTDEGVLKRSDLMATLSPARWSINFMNGEASIQRALFLATMAFAVAVILGYRTRLATVLLWVMVFSIQTRNPNVLSGADTLLRMLLFWGMFLPMGARWSLDARHERTTKTSLLTHVVSVASVGITLQIAFMYWFTAIKKDSDQWRSDFTALYYALGAKDLTTWFGNWVFEAPMPVLQALTFGAILLEVGVPFLFFFPWKTGPVRTFAALSVIFFHLNIVAMMEVGIFPWENMAAMAVILPAWFWDALLPRMVTPMRGWIAGLTDRLASGRPQLQPLAGRVHATQIPATATATPIGSARRLRPLDTAMTYATAGVAEMSSQATASIERETSRREDRSRGIWTAHPLINLLCAGAIVLIFFWNVTTVSSFTLSPAMKSVAYTAGLYQDWSMFAPRPRQSTVWYVMVGELQDGQQVDLLTPIMKNDMSLMQLPNTSQSYGVNMNDKYWRKYLTAIQDNKNGKVKLAGYACRQWNGVHVGDQALASVQLFIYTARTLPDHQQGDPNERLLGNYTCL